MIGPARPPPRGPGPSLSASDFEALGEFAEAGVRATRLALERAARSFEEGRVPIAAAAVHTEEDGALTTVTVGSNGRIPAPGTEGPGYPTDHGETAAIRRIEDVGAWDWSRIVFATTLSPCIMCARALAYLGTLGLDKIVIAEAETYPGTKDRLARLPGMTIVELASPEAVRMMRAFARTYPWDWAADIGNLPPADTARARRAAEDTEVGGRLLVWLADRYLTDHPAAAAILGPSGELLSSAGDRRAVSGGNPSSSAPMIVMGEAGSAVNLRECALLFASGCARDRIGLAEFGHASLGACELFRPAALLADAPFEDELAEALSAVDVRLVSGRAGGHREGPDGEESPRHRML